MQMSVLNTTGGYSKGATVPVKGIAALHARIARALHAHYTQCPRSSHAESTHLTRKYTKMRVITRV